MPMRTPRRVPHGGLWRRRKVLSSPGTRIRPIIRRPPFATVASETRLGHYVAHPILVVGDDITTDHISPVGQIPAKSDAGRHLIARHEAPHDLNVYASRRGNWEVMLRGLFTNRSLSNLLDPTLPPGQTIHVPSGERLSLWERGGTL